MSDFRVGDRVRNWAGGVALVLPPLRQTPREQTRILDLNDGCVGCVYTSHLTIVERAWYAPPDVPMVAMTQTELMMIWEAAEALEDEDDGQGSNEISQVLRKLLERTSEARGEVKP
jgi:hypothetical protein